MHAARVSGAARERLQARGGKLQGEEQAKHANLVEMKNYQSCFLFILNKYRFAIILLSLVFLI